MPDSTLTAFGLLVVQADVSGLDAAGNEDRSSDREHQARLKEQSGNSRTHEAKKDIVLIEFVTRTH